MEAFAVSFVPCSFAQSSSKQLCAPLCCANFMCQVGSPPHSIPTHPHTQTLTLTVTHTKHCTRAYKLYVCSNEQPLHSLQLQVSEKCWPTAYAMLVLAPSALGGGILARPDCQQRYEHLMRFKIILLGSKLPNWYEQFAITDFVCVRLICS